MNKFEHYEPSEEEVKNAENMMGPQKAKLSALREGSVELLKRKGVDGYLESESDGKNGGFTVSGKINGHSVILRHPGSSVSDDESTFLSKLEGEVDGFKLLPEEAERFYKKYSSNWAHLRKEDIEAAGKEEITPGRAEALKDIGI